MKKKIFLTGALLVSLNVLAQQTFTKGNIVVMRYGDGVTKSGAVPVILEEYTPEPNATKKKVVTMPTVVDGSNLRLVGQELSSTPPNYLSLSTDARHLLLTGYNAAPGTESVRVYGTSNASRVIGIVDAAGNVNTSVFINSTYTSGIYMAVGDGQNVCLCGYANGIRHFSIANPATKTVVASSPASSSSIGVYGNQLYALTTAISGTRFGTIGTGTPSTAQTYANIAGLPTSGDSYKQFVFLDTDNIAGNDVVYFTDATAGTINKFSLNASNSTWESKGAYSVTGSNTAVSALTGKYDGANSRVVLYTTTADAVLQIVDASAGNANISASQNTVVTNTIADTEFRGVAFAPDASTLPVKLTSFTVSKEGDHVKLNWKTASETNNDRFEILRSDNRTDFKVIGSVTGMGSSSSINSYSFSDYSPLTGTNYYRLRQVDYDAKSELSEIVAFESALKKDVFKIFSSGDSYQTAQIFSNSDQTLAELSVTDMSGKLLITRKTTLAKGSNSVKIDAQPLVPGVYIASLYMNGEKYSVKFLKYN